MTPRRTQDRRAAEQTGSLSQRFPKIHLAVGAKVMITINRMSGFVTVSNKNSLQCMDIRAGMVMQSQGADLLVVTGANGIVELTIDGHYVLVEENSYLHLRPDGRTFLRKHKERLLGRNTAKSVCGHIWARIRSMVGREEGEIYIQANNAVGIRG